MWSLAMSAIVSVMAQKIGGELIHPMGKPRGIPTSGGLPGTVGNNTARKWSTVGILRHSAEAIQNVLFADIYWAMLGVGMPDTNQDVLAPRRDQTAWTPGGHHEEFHH